MYAVTETILRDSIWLTEPDISNKSTIPVSGALTIAVKNPAIASRTKLLIYCCCNPNHCVPIIANAPPIIAPNIKSGKKIPPGAPDPKLTAENTNFTTSTRSTVFNTISPSVSETISSCPLPSTSGMQSPSTPAVRNAIRSRPVSSRHFGFL